MAKRKGPNKSDLVREILGKNPRTKVKEIVTQLAEKGVKISANMVYLVKSKMKARSRRMKRQKVAALARRDGIADPVALILQLKTLAHEVGGFGNLRQLVDVLGGE